MNPLPLPALPIINVLILLLLGFLVHLKLQKTIQALVVLAGGDWRRGVFIYSLIFLPGVMVHEMTHFLTAAILGVRTGEISLIPKIPDSTSQRTALGSVRIAKTDFFRESIIGAMPMIASLSIMYVLVEIFIRPILVNPNDLIASLIQFLNHFSIRLALVTYFIFTLANTMYLSKEDTRTWLPMLLFLGIIGLLLGLSGVLNPVLEAFWGAITYIANVLRLCLALVLLIQLVVWLMLWSWQKIWERVSRKRVVY